MSAFPPEINLFFHAHRRYILSMPTSVHRKKASFPVYLVRPYIFHHYYQYRPCDYETCISVIIIWEIRSVTSNNKVQIHSNILVFINWIHRRFLLRWQRSIFISRALISRWAIHTGSKSHLFQSNTKLFAITNIYHTNHFPHILFHSYEANRPVTFSIWIILKIMN